jgi:enoyl-CoA hydratase/carnithine racemase
MNYSDLTLEQFEGVATITVNRPDKLNALRAETYQELTDALRRAGANDTVGVVVLTGAGDRAFSAGGDLTMAQTMLTSLHSARDHFFRRMLPVSTAIMHIGVPVICAVNGGCVGGGAELSLFCDYVIAAEEAFFIFNGTEIGGCSWWGAPQLLPVLVGLRRAEEILYESRRVEAAEAERIGLITRAVPRAMVQSEVDRRCQRLLDLSAEGLRLTKAGLRATKELLLATMAVQADMNAAATAGPDLHHAFDAFLAGKRMDWRAGRPRMSDSDSQLTKEGGT